jgi:hypothetical protein
MDISGDMFSVEVKKFVFKYFLLIAFVISYSIYFYQSHNNGKLLEHTFFFVIFMYLIQYYEIPQKINDDEFYAKKDKEAFIDRLTKKYEDHDNFLSDRHYYLIKNDILGDFNHKLKFIPKLKYLQDILQELEFVSVYDNHAYMKIVYLIESFMFFYYNAITNHTKKRCQLGIEDLRMIRKKVLAIMSHLAVDLPKHDKNRIHIDHLLFKNRVIFKEIMNKKIFIMSKYCNGKYKVYDYVEGYPEPSNTTVNYEIQD